MRQSRLLLAFTASVGFFFTAGVATTEAADKVTICHRPPGNPDNSQTISVAEKAVAAHLKHGDQLGECPTGVTLAKIVVFGYLSRSGTSDSNVNPCRDPGDLPKDADRFGSYTDQDGEFLHPDGTFQTRVVAMGLFTDGSFRDMTETVNWRSSDTALATVSNAAGDKGRVVTAYTRNVAGSLIDRTVTISADGPGLLDDDITLTIVDLFLEAVVINRCNGCDSPSAVAELDPLNLLVGSTDKLQLHGRFGLIEGTLSSGDDFFCLNEDATWVSNSAAVSVLNSAGSRGTVTGDHVGTAVISARIGLLSDIISVNVSGAAIRSIGVVPSLVTIGDNETAQFQAIATLTDGSVVNVTGNLATTFTEANPSGFATVIDARNGVVRADDVGGPTEIRVCNTNADQPMVCSDDPPGMAGDVNGNGLVFVVP